jgi:hypothetical protein
MNATLNRKPKSLVFLSLLPIGGPLLILIGCATTKGTQPTPTTSNGRGQIERPDDLRGPWAGDILFLPDVADLRDFEKRRKDLETQLRSQDAGIRAKAAESLGGWLDPRAITALNTVLDDADPGVRQAARGAVQRLADYHEFSSQRPLGSILTHSSPISVEFSSPVQCKDRSGNLMEGQLNLWEASGDLRKMIPQNMWLGQQVELSRIAGLNVDQRLIAGNLAYFLFAKEGKQGFSLYYWPTATIYDNWKYANARLSLGSEVVIDFLDLRTLSATAGQVSYRLLSPGRLLIAKSSGTSEHVLAVGEQFKDQSGGLISMRDWLLESKAGNKVFLSQIQPDPAIFRVSRAAFMETTPRDENQTMGTLQISEKGVRMLACVNAGMPDYILRKESCTQSVMIPEPRELGPARIAIGKPLMKTCGFLPEPAGASYEGRDATDLRTVASVEQVRDGVWSLLCLEAADRVAFEARLDCSNNTLAVRVLFGEGSTLRFPADKWVTYEGCSYSAGAIKVHATQNEFVNGTRRKVAGIVQVHSDGQWHAQ